MARRFSGIVDVREGVEQEFSFEDFSRLVDSFCVRIMAENLPYQSHVAIVAKNSVFYLAALSAIRKTGNVATPIFHRLAPQQLADWLAQSRAVFAFCDLASAEGLPKPFRFALLDPASWQSSEGSMGMPPRMFPLNRLALCIRTSGSSGRPKGVLIPEKARRAFVMASLARRELSGSGPNRCGSTLVASPLSHILAINMTEPLLAAEEELLVLLPRFEPRSYVEAIGRHGITELSMVPTMWAMILQQSGLAESMKADSVRQVYFSSEPLSARLLEAAARFFPNAEIENCYGLSEVGPNLFGPHPGGLARPGLSVGHPRRGIDYRLVDGKLEIRAPFMFEGYELSSGAPPEAVTPDGFFRTDDVFTVDENGFYFFQRRADDMIVSGGKKIYPREVEAVLLRHPEILAGAVVGVPDVVKGERPYAFVVKAAGSPLSEQVLKEFFVAEAAAYLLPGRIWFLDQLPGSGALKVDRMALRELALKMLHGAP
jgi:long-chain acyl-CoA synthetase